jgi:hypothetical protein
VATGRFKIPAHLSILSIGMSSLGPNLIEEAEATLEEASGAFDPPRSRSAARRRFGARFPVRRRVRTEPFDSVPNPPDRGAARRGRPEPRGQAPHPR